MIIKDILKGKILGYKFLVWKEYEPETEARKKLIKDIGKSISKMRTSRLYEDETCGNMVVFIEETKMNLEDIDGTIYNKE